MFYWSNGNFVSTTADNCWFYLCMFLDTSAVRNPHSPLTYILVLAVIALSIASAAHPLQLPHVLVPCNSSVAYILYICFIPSHLLRSPSVAWVTWGAGWSMVISGLITSALDGLSSMIISIFKFLRETVHYERIDMLLPFGSKKRVNIAKTSLCCFPFPPACFVGQCLCTWLLFLCSYILPLFPQLHARLIKAFLSNMRQKRIPPRVITLLP